MRNPDARPARRRSSHPGARAFGRQGYRKPKNITKAYGDKLLFRKTSPFMLPPGGIVGVIGPNGAGKSTLFKILTGKEQPDSGTVEIGDTVRLGYVDQSRDDLDPKHNVWEEIKRRARLHAGQRPRHVNARLLGAFNFKGADQQKNVGKLSGGERNRVHMAKMPQKGRQRPAAGRADQ